MEVHEMGEFSLDKGSRKNGIKGLIGSIILFIVVPVILLYVVGFVESIAISKTSSDVNEDDIRSLFEVVDNILILSLIFGLPAIAFRTLGKFYPAGNRARLTFRLLYGTYLAVWLLIITSGGVITVNAGGIASSMAGDSSDYSISGLTLVIDMSGLMILIVLLALLKNIIPVAEYKGARKGYLEKMNKPENTDQMA
jgi:hypothetical protein